MYHKQYEFCHAITWGEMVRMLEIRYSNICPPTAVEEQMAGIADHASNNPWWDQDSDWPDEVYRPFTSTRNSPPPYTILHENASWYRTLRLSLHEHKHLWIKIEQFFQMLYKHLCSKYFVLSILYLVHAWLSNGVPGVLGIQVADRI